MFFPQYCLLFTRERIKCLFFVHLESLQAEIYVCAKCNRTFKQKSRYDRHVANHPSEKHYLCHACQKTFTRMSHLDKHLRTHTDERRHVCAVCGAAFILPHHLVRHSLVHTGVRPFECDICHKQFTRKAGLSQHQYVHTGVRPFVCDVQSCEKQFTDRTTLRRHMLTHSREKPFICKECDKTFRTKSACRKHYLRHFKPEESYKCGICEEMFKSDILLQQHALIHKQKQRNGMYRCGFCLRVFKTPFDLDAHVPLHESGLTHVCSQCPAKFYTETDLFSHITKHVDGEYTDVEQQIERCKFKFETEDVQLPSTVSTNEQTEVNIPTSSTNDGKVVVVLQLPPSVVSTKNKSPLRLENIQHLLGTAQIDKLLVTTDKLSDSSTAFSLELSQDQQQSIHQILQQTTSIADYIGPSKDLNTVDATTVCQTVEDLSAQESLASSAELNDVHTSYVLTTVPHVNETPEKETSQYIIMNEAPSLTPVDETSYHTPEQYSLPLTNTVSKMRKIGGESVFKSNKTLRSPESQAALRPQSLIVVDENGVVSMQPNNKLSTQGTTGQEVLNMVSQYENPGFSESNVTPQFPIPNGVNSITIGNNSIVLEERQNGNKPSFFSASDYENSILSENEANFS